MRVPKILRPRAPQRRRKLRVPKSKLIQLEREIGATADSIRQRKKTQSVIARFFKNLKTASAYCGRLFLIAVRPPMPRAHELTSRFKRTVASKREAARTVSAARPVPRAPRQASHSRHTPIPKEQVVENASAPGSFLVSIGIGLLVICGILIAILFQQIRNMRVETVLWKQRLETAETHLGQLEKLSQQKVAQQKRAEGRKEVDGSPRHIPITLSNDDMKVIRAFIKVLPSNPGAEGKIHVGDVISDTTAVPVPQLLVSQIPKLRGARFLVDQNGAIVIIGEGANRADAVIEPR